MRLLFLPLLLITSLLGISCESRQESYAGIADHNGIVTGNSRPVPKKERKTMREIGEDAIGIIPDW